MRISSLNLNLNRNVLFKSKLLSKNFSSLNVMRETNISKIDIKNLSKHIKSEWVKPGSEKIVNKIFFKIFCKTCLNFLIFFKKFN